VESLTGVQHSSLFVRAFRNEKNVLQRRNLIIFRKSLKGGKREKRVELRERRELRERERERKETDR
jgi:hypothetical protein